MAKIPDFETLQEAAEFWDTHDSTEYFDDMEEVEIEVALRHNNPRACAFTPPSANFGEGGF